MLSFKSSLHILESNPLSDVSEQIFPPSLWCVFSFSWHCLLQSRSFHQLRNSFFHGLCLWYSMKGHCLVQSHIDFLLCYLLGVLQFCVLYLHKCFTFLVNFCEERTVCVWILFFLFFFCMWIPTCSSSFCWRGFVCSIVKSRLTVFMWVCFWALCLVLLICQFHTVLITVVLVSQ